MYNKKKKKKKKEQQQKDPVSLPQIDSSVFTSVQGAIFIKPLSLTLLFLDNTPHAHITYAVIERSSVDGCYIIKPLKQKQFVHGLCYLLQEIYGIENKTNEKTKVNLKKSFAWCSNIVVEYGTPEQKAVGKAPFTHSRFSLRFTTIHPDFSWSEKSGWIGMNHGEKWKYSVSLRFQ